MKVYEKIYEYYILKINEGTLLPGDRMPSIRETEKVLGVSRTSVETAYMQLAADGYIYSEEKVGFFVTDMVSKKAKEQEARKAKELDSEKTKYKIEYDFATIREDASVSCLDLWRRYIKSALRQEDRLLAYAANQGEEDLREEISNYVRKTRNIICGPDDIVIGAGFQSLLPILIPLLDGDKTISFPTREFKDGAASFKNSGYEVSYRNKNAHIMYVTPAYMTKWGDVMSMRRRQEIIEHSRNENHIIIEDDYQNEFVFSAKPTPSLFALSGGENVVYVSSFSRVLLPSVRISFMILPRELKEKYFSIRHLFNQPASKAEQIALAQFIRDGHLIRHIRKMHRLYEEKRAVFIECVEDNMGNAVTLYAGDSGMEFGLSIPSENISEDLLCQGIAVIPIEEKDGRSNILLSCSGMSLEQIREGIKCISQTIERVRGA